MILISNLRDKKIVSFSHDNTRSSTPTNQSVSITKSQGFGNEFSGSISFNRKTKSGIFGGMKNEYSIVYKKNRFVNEALGANTSATVPPKKWGYIDMIYVGTRMVEN